jgi:hypothetical protein
MKRIRGRILIGVISVAITWSAQAQEAFVDYPEKFEGYLRTLHNSKPGALAFDKQAARDVEGWRKAGRSKLGDLLGLSRMARELEHFKPTVTLGAPKDAGDHTRQKGEIETEPGFRIPFWMLKPKARSGPSAKRPLAVCSHGHDPIGRDTYAGVWHDDAHKKLGLSRGGPVAVQAVRRGFIAIVPATRGLARDASLPDLKGRHGKRVCRAQLIQALLAGRTAVGERVWDVQRLLDWALAQPDVDASRVLMTGNSGGGVLTVYAAAMDERITIAVPSCSFTSFTSSTGYVFHCDCCLIPGVQRELGDMADVGGLISPRALLAVHGRKDGLHHLAVLEKNLSVNGARKGIDSIRN